MNKKKLAVIWSMTDSVLLYIRSISHQFFLGSLCCMLKYSTPGTTKAVQPLDYISGQHFHSNQTVKQASFDLRYKPVHFKEKCIESIHELVTCHCSLSQAYFLNIFAKIQAGKNSTVQKTQGFFRPKLNEPVVIVAKWISKLIPFSAFSL